HEKGDDDGSDDESRQTEKGNPAKRRKKDHERMHLGVFSDQLRPKNVIDHGNDPCSDGQDKDSLPHIAEKNQDDSRRQPDDRRSDHRYDGKEYHDESPDSRRRNAGDPKDQSAQETLYYTHDHRSFERGPADRHELGDEELVVLVSERRKLRQVLQRFFPIDEKIEKSEKHHENPKDETGDPLVGRLQ